MTQLTVYNIKKEEVGKHELPDSVFAEPRYEHLFHESVRLHLATLRAGTAKTKSRGEVRGGGKKPWRQKGTGRARQGTIRATQWVGGGRPHGPKVRSYAARLPKKMRSAALRSALSRRVSEEALYLLDALTVDSPRTKDMKDIVGRFGDRRILVVIGEKDDNVLRSASNLHNVTVRGHDGISVYDVLKHDVVLSTVDAADRIAERLAP